MARIGIALTVRLLLKGDIDPAKCARRGDMAFFKEGVQLRRDRIMVSNMVKVRFRGSKGDQEKRGAVLGRMSEGGSEGGRNENAVDLLER